MKVKKCVSEKHSLSLTGPQWFSPSLKVREVWFNDLGTTRTSEPESLNIGTPFQMTLEAVGTPATRLRQNKTARCAALRVVLRCPVPGRPRVVSGKHLTLRFPSSRSPCGDSFATIFSGLRIT